MGITIAANAGAVRSTVTVQPYSTVTRQDWYTITVITSRKKPYTAGWASKRLVTHYATQLQAMEALRDLLATYDTREEINVKLTHEPYVRLTTYDGEADGKR